MSSGSVCCPGLTCRCSASWGKCLREQGAGHIFVVAGGVIPEQDYESLKESGVDVIIPQEARAELIVSTITELVAVRGRI